MGSSVASLMSNIQEMLDDTKHSWILRHYQLNKKFVAVNDMPIVHQ